jgi:amidase
MVWKISANSPCETDDPEIFDGAHISLQLVGRRLQEEKMLALGELLAKAL